MSMTMQKLGFFGSVHDNVKEAIARARIFELYNEAS